MISLVRYFSAVVFSAAFLSLFLGVIIKDKPTAYSNGSDIVIHWTSADETGVLRYDILRRAGTTGDFLAIVSVDRKGDNSTYEYIDRSVFKADSHIYQYIIRIENGENPPPETEPLTVSHLSSAARSTWGSIKAMFR
ncbi:MAG TPA: hypothetical protein VMM57_09075 [Bacteroidota bacterium]|nr:hypothetical protein [Bacteroidota bacterium]